jgi:hypothetical protein
LVKPGLWEEVMATTGGLCARCRAAPAKSVHHRLKKSRGGRLIEDTFNCVPLCGSGTTGCHGHVEHTNEYPWVIPGYVVTNKLTGRPLYRGSDPSYFDRYTG